MVTDHLAVADAVSAGKPLPADKMLQASQRFERLRMDWRVCITENPAVDFEVAGTHIGMVFNPIVLDIVAHRLAGKWPRGYERPE